MSRMPILALIPAVLGLAGTASAADLGHRRALPPAPVLMAPAFTWTGLYVGGQLGYMWGKDIILAYVDVTPAAGRGSPSFGYTYQLTGYPFVEEPYYGRNEKTWYYPYTDARMPVLVSGYAGYLIKNAVA